MTANTEKLGLPKPAKRAQTVGFQTAQKTGPVKEVIRSTKVWRGAPVEGGVAFHEPTSAKKPAEKKAAVPLAQSPLTEFGKKAIKAAGKAGFANHEPSVRRVTQTASPQAGKARSKKGPQKAD